MGTRPYLILFSIGIIVASLVATFQSVPGYMDSSYYYAGGLQLVRGEGFSEQLIWNFLDDPSGLPHPSHGYWMPLASLVAALGMLVFGGLEFSFARIGFLVLAGLLPPLTAALSFQFTCNKKSAIIAGLFAAFSGFYLPFMATTDTFALYMILGVILFLILGRFSKNPGSSGALFLGVIAGFLHITRADGLIWLPILLFSIVSILIATGNREKINTILITTILGYGFIAAPWVLRNIQAFGTPFSPGGNHALWLTNYDEIFSFPAARLSFSHWWQSGIREILRVRFWALGINLQRVLAEQGLIVLSPFILSGLWKLRSDHRVQTGLLGWLITFLVMTFVFPFAGARGGFFHSGAAIQPLFWAVTPVGLEHITGWAAKHRGWNQTQANRVFGWTLFIFSLLISVTVTYQGVIGSNPSEPVWSQTAAHYQTIETALVNLGAYENDVVMVKNPPEFHIISNRKAIVIPDGDAYTLAKVADRYAGRYLLLERDHTQGLAAIYENPKKLPVWLEYLSTVGGTHIFLIKCSVCRVVP